MTLYMGDVNWWNNRFSARSSKLMNHESKLEEDMSYFPKSGNVLDVACGDGRNTIFLSQKGYDVEAIDFSEVALNRLDQFAEAEHQTIKTKLVNLSSSKEVEGLDDYNIIVINHYRLNKLVFPELVRHLKKDGILWVNGFYTVPSSNPNITSDELLADEDFEEIENATLDSKELYENGDHKLVRYIWRKNG